jgi:hypothetical protein
MADGTQATAVIADSGSVSGAVLLLALAAALAALFALFLAAGGAGIFAAFFAGLTSSEGQRHREHSGGEGEFDDVFHGVCFLGFSLLFVVLVLPSE